MRELIQIDFFLFINLFNLVGFERKPTELNSVDFQFQLNYNITELAPNRITETNLVWLAWSINPHPYASITIIPREFEAHVQFSKNQQSIQMKMEWENHYLNYHQREFI